MYTFRKVVDQVQYNQLIGKDYSLIERDSNYDEFRKAYFAALGKNHVADLDTEADSHSQQCYAILIVNGGSETIPLYKEHKNYIMTESGKTFSNLTYK